MCSSFLLSTPYFAKLILCLQRRQAKSEYNPLPLCYLEFALNRLINRRISSSYIIKRYIIAMLYASFKKLYIIVSKFIYNPLLYYFSHYYKLLLGPYTSLK